LIVFEKGTDRDDDDRATNMRRETLDRWNDIQRKKFHFVLEWLKMLLLVVFWSIKH